MNEYEGERRPPRSPWPLLLLLLLLGLIATGVWLFRIDAGVDRSRGTAVPEDTGVGVRGDVEDGTAPVLLLPAAGGETTYEA